MNQFLPLAFVVLVGLSASTRSEAQPTTRARDIIFAIQQEDGVVAYRGTKGQYAGLAITAQGEQGERYIIRSGEVSGVSHLEVIISLPAPSGIAIHLMDLGLDDNIDLVRVLGDASQIPALPQGCADSCGEWQGFYEELLEILMLVFPPRRV